MHWSYDTMDGHFRVPHNVDGMMGKHSRSFPSRCLKIISRFGRTNAAAGSTKRGRWERLVFYSHPHSMETHQEDGKSFAVSQVRKTACLHMAHHRIFCMKHQDDRAGRIAAKITLCGNTSFISISEAPRERIQKSTRCNSKPHFAFLPHSGYVLSQPGLKP